MKQESRRWWIQAIKMTADYKDSVEVQLWQVLQLKHSMKYWPNNETKSLLSRMVSKYLKI